MQNLDRNVDVFVMTQKLTVEDPQMQFSYRLADVLVMAQRLTVDDVSGCSCHDEKTDGGIPETVHSSLIEPRKKSEKKRSPRVKSQGNLRHQETQELQESQKARKLTRPLCAKRS